MSYDLAMRPLAVPALLLAVPLAAAAEPLQVRASEAVAPCVRAAAESYGADAVVTVAAVRMGGGDVLVGASGEVDRALESGRALADTDVEIARVPWVLLSEGDADLDALFARGAAVAVPEGPESYEARRVLGERFTGERLRPLKGDRAEGEAAQADQSAAPAAARVVPLPMAGGGARRTVREIPPLLAKAAVSAGAAEDTSARAFVEYLGSEAGRAAFSACGDADPAGAATWRP